MSNENLWSRPLAALAVGVALVLSYGAGYLTGHSRLPDLDRRLGALEARFLDSKDDAGTEPLSSVSVKPEQSVGSRNAKVALIEYGDFQCPYCRSFHRGTYPQLRDRYIKQGRLLFSFKHMPLASIHSFAESAAVAAECAGRLGHFWAMQDALFAEDLRYFEADLTTLASRLGLAKEPFRDCVSSSGPFALLSDIDEAKRLGFTGTPSFVLGDLNPDGRVRVRLRWKGVKPLAEFMAAIDERLRANR